MTVSNIPRRADYDGDGSTVEFPVTFQFYEIAVYVDGVLQVEGADYVVSQEAPGLEGSVIFIADNDATPASNSKIVILGTTDVTQSVDYVNNDDFPAESHEGALDRLTMIAQEQNTKFEGFVRAVQWHKPIAPLNFEDNPETIIFVDENGDVSLQTASQILGGVNIDDAIQSAEDAEAAQAAAEAARDAAAASAAAAAISEANAASATDILAANPHFLGLPEFEAGLRVGADGEGDSLIEFYDDANDTWRSFWWDEGEEDFFVETNAGAYAKVWHNGNQASQAEAEAGTDDTKGMTALRVAQAIAALAGEGAFPSGTIMLFGNSAAPPGWTKKTDLDDYAIRVTSGSVGTSGSFAYSTVFASRTPTGTVGGTVLDVSRIPSHRHSYAYRSTTGTAGTDNGVVTNVWRSNSTQQTGYEGGGGSHDHPFTGNPMAFNVNTVSFIRAEKD